MNTTELIAEFDKDLKSMTTEELKQKLDNIIGEGFTVPFATHNRQEESNTEYPMPSNDDFINPFNSPMKKDRLCDNPFLLTTAQENVKWWTSDYWLNKFTVYLINRELELDQKTKDRELVRSLKTYFQNFNNERIPSIWQQNSNGEQIRNKHRLVRDRILSKNLKIDGEPSMEDQVKIIYDKISNANLKDKIAHLVTESKINDLWKNNMMRPIRKSLMEDIWVENTIDPSDIDPSFTNEDGQRLFDAHVNKHEGLPQ